MSTRINSVEPKPSCHRLAAHRLAAHGLALGHGKLQVIEDLELALPDGQVTAIVGPNGCGKSTLLSGLARIHRPRSGAVLLDGRDIFRQSSREVARTLALLPQETSAPEGMTVMDLVRFGRQPHQDWLRQWSGEDQAAVQRALAAADVSDLADRALDTLSGGQRQRAWIAMSIAQQTPLLLLDEPTSALDLGHQIEVFELIRSLADAGKTVAMVVHDLVSACRYADHLIAMQQGQIVAQGRPEEVVTPELIHALYQITCDLLTDPATGAPIPVNIRRA
ncbi:ABC transporter ATP-binding protein [Marinobacter sp.]|uniref:ABC transporter ATP-binding protein n=1 Tax=Marinobacter sp. TaxID=50741 RepID=UPI0035C6B131